LSLTRQVNNVNQCFQLSISICASIAWVTLVFNSLQWIMGEKAFAATLSLPGNRAELGTHLIIKSVYRVTVICYVDFMQDRCSLSLCAPTPRQITAKRIPHCPGLVCIIVVLNFTNVLSQYFFNLIYIVVIRCRYIIMVSSSN
jgi:hypothetical protein